MSAWTTLDWNLFTSVIAATAAIAAFVKSSVLAAEFKKFRARYTKSEDAHALWASALDRNITGLEKNVDAAMVDVRTQSEFVRNSNHLARLASEQANNAEEIANATARSITGLKEAETRRQRQQK